MGTEDADGILVVELQDSLDRLKWYSPMRLFSQTSMQMWHFVALLDGEVRYESPTFAAPFSWGTLPLGRTMTPAEDWARGMRSALEELRAEILADEWVEAGCGAQPWEFRYRRSPDGPRAAASAPASAVDVAVVEGEGNGGHDREGQEHRHRRG